MRVRSIISSALFSAVAVAALILSTTAGAAQASDRLVVHSAEMGVGKFHRQDNKVHPYAADNAWLPYILPDNAASDQMLVQQNGDGSYTIFFTNLDELLSAVVKISATENKKVSVLNVHGHGLPGAMWFPPSADALNDWTCSDWKDAANGSDQGNYDQYYSAVSVDEIQQIHSIADNPNVHMGCTTGVQEWTTAVEKNPAFKAVFATDAQLHFLSCVVGLGTQGDAFTKGMAALLLPAGKGHVEASMDFGLGDWSMPGGMGFWDYQSDDQVNHDNSIYTVDHKDSEIAQKGTVRMASYSASTDTSSTATGVWNSSQLADMSYMSTIFETNITIPSATITVPVTSYTGLSPLPSKIRVPGTNKYVIVQ